MTSNTANAAKSMPRVTVGLPVYNGEKFLGEAIESVLDQTFEDFELVISDNASTDATEEICRDYAARDRRVRYARAPQNRGAAWNFNRAFELAGGEYFKWLAHDDVIGPRYLARTVEALDHDASLVLCHSQTGIIDGEGELIADPQSDARRACDLQGITQEMEHTRLEMGQAARAYQRYLGILLYSIRNHEVFGVIRRARCARPGCIVPTAAEKKCFWRSSACGAALARFPRSWRSLAGTSSVSRRTRRHARRIST